MAFHTTCAVLLPIHSHIRKQAIPSFEKFLPLAGIKDFEVNRTELTIKTPIGEVWFLSFEKNYKNIASWETGITICDELDTVPLDVALEVADLLLGRTRLPLIDHKGQLHQNKIDYTSTPVYGLAGFMNEYFINKKSDEKKLIIAKSTSNPHTPKHVIEGMLKQYNEVQRKAYIEGDPTVSLAGNLVYHNYNRDKHHTNREYQPHKDYNLLAGIDFNYNHGAVIIAVHEDNKIKIIDEIINTKDTDDAAIKLKQKYPNSNFTIFPDYSGTARRTNSDLTDIEILEQHGFRVEAHPNLRVRARVNTATKYFAEDKILINKFKCRELVRCLMSQTYVNDAPDKRNNIDHPIDAFGYLVVNQDLNENRGKFSVKGF